MKEYINKILILGLFIILIPIKVNAIVSPTDRFYINDYANILSQETEDYVYEKSEKLDYLDGTQIVVVTIDSLDDKALELYANELFNEWGIGDADKNNGLLLLLAFQEREFRVEVGYGLEGILPDSKTGRYQDEYLIPYLIDDKWDEGIRNLYDAFYKEIVEENGLDLEYNDPIIYEDNYTDEDAYIYDRESTSTNDEKDIILFISGAFYGAVFCGCFLVSKKGKRENIVKKVGLFSFIIAILLFIFNYHISILLIGFSLGIFIVYIIPENSISSSSSVDYSYSSSRSHSSSSSSRSSSSSHSGGGGRSGGGGSSRRF